MDNTSYTPEEPIAAIATALAPSALGIIRVSGKNCVELISKIFSRPKALLEAGGNTIVYGWIKDQNKKIDEVLVSVFRAPKSFTGEEMAEISCHGGTAVISAVFDLILKSGFRKAERGEFTFRAYINGKTDLTKAEAVREIIEGRTVLSAAKAAGRLAGNVYKEIAAIKKSIIDTLAEIEVEIEYPEDEETIADSFNRNKLVEAISRLETLAASWKSEKLYQEGARIVLCGKTNAGKSSLFNSLLKEERAIVSDIEGTTRDWIESWVSFDGLPARLFDTAGLRSTDDYVELKGLESTRELSGEADIVLYLADSSDDVKAIDREFLVSCKEPLIFIWNKIDLCTNAADDQTGTAACPPALPDDIKKLIPDFKGEVKISARTGSGIGALTELVKSILLQGTSSDREQAGLGSARQKAYVQAALESVRHSLVAADDNYTLDAVVQDLEDALDALGEVTGEVTPDDVLESIFSHFCVGK